MSEGDAPAEKPRRRPRYAGKHPRRFDEKYKEHQPDRYAADVAKVMAAGKTPAGMHRPIMVREILEVLKPAPGQIVVDCTLGYGGHAAELLRAIQPGGLLVGLDHDPVELPKTEARLRKLVFPPETLVVKRMNYAGLAGILSTIAPDGADIILADLGLSSMQIDDPSRGFTFKTDGPLDMRMNPARAQSARDLIAKAGAAELARWLREYGDEPSADVLAAAITRVRPETTRALAELIRETIAVSGDRRAAEDAEGSVRRVFQAVRIAVNDELSALETWLRNLPLCLKTGGRVAVLTFHSGEDRRVKHAFKAGLQSGVYRAINSDVLRPSASERYENPRSSPAKLRWAIRA